MNVLLVEDDPKVAAHIEKGFIGEGHSCVAARDGEKGLAEALSDDVDVIVLDVMLPLLDGFTILERLRKDNVLTPVLLLSAKSQVEDKVRGLRSGANDYLTKPFHVEELTSRLNALIRRSAGKASTLINNGPYSLDIATSQVLVEQVSVNLSAHEFKVFKYLMLHVGEVVSKTTLTEHIYDQDFDLDSNVIEVFIRRLRKKLDPDSKYNFIETKRGQGYRLINFPE